MTDRDDPRSSSCVGINKSFGAVHVLHDVDLEVYPGQVTALVGDNGAGKSTLVKCIAGIHPRRHRRASSSRASRSPSHSPKDAAALGIEIVYQDLALCDNLDIVAEHVPRPRAQERHRARRGVDGAGRPRDARLAVGAHREVGAPAASPACPAASARPWRSPRRCCGSPRSSSSTSRPPRSASPRPGRCSTWSAGSPTRGLGVVLISHNMNDVFEVADRITALYLGRVAADVKRADVTAQPGRRADHRRPLRRPRPRAATAADEHLRTPDMPPKRRPTGRRDRRGHRRRRRRLRRRLAPTPACAGRRPSATTSTELRGGDLGALPAVLGLVVLFILFYGLRPDTFLTQAQPRQPARPGAADHHPRHGPGLRAAARRDRPVRRRGRRRLRRRHGHADGRHGMAWLVAVLAGAASPAPSSACSSALLVAASASRRSS